MISFKNNADNDSYWYNEKNISKIMVSRSYDDSAYMTTIIGLGYDDRFYFDNIDDAIKFAKLISSQIPKE